MIPKATPTAVVVPVVRANSISISISYLKDKGKIRKIERVIKRPSCPPPCPGRKSAKEVSTFSFIKNRKVAWTKVNSKLSSQVYRMWIG
jgi:hypothetical protein